MKPTSIVAGVDLWGKTWRLALSTGNKGRNEDMSSTDSSTDLIFFPSL